MISTRSFGILVSSLLLLGCTRYRPEDLTLPFPPRPPLTWQLCKIINQARMEDVLCLSQADGAALAKWLDKVEAFKRARERLQDY